MMKPTNSISYQDGIHRWCEGKLSSRPEYYSGRDPSYGDLGPDHLKMLHDGIKAEIGDPHAAEFVKLVKARDDLAATPFLCAYRRFVENGYVYDAEDDAKPRDERMEITGHGLQRDIGAMFSLASLMGSGGPRVRKFESMRIKSGFLVAIGEKAPAQAGAEILYEL